MPRHTKGRSPEPPEINKELLAILVVGEQIGSRNCRALGREHSVESETKNCKTFFSEKEESTWQAYG
jgi:hypothetical protein